MNVSIPDSVSTTALDAVTSPIKSHAVWFQNFNTAVHIHLNVNGAATNTEFYLQPAASASQPTSLIIQSSGGDSTLVNENWTAFQSSGGAVNLKCGRW